MRKSLIVTLALSLVTLVASAQMKVKPQQKSGASPLAIPGAQRAAENFPRISREDALKLYKAGKAVFVDVRSNEQYTYGHIKGAMSIPGSQLVSRFKEIPRHKTIIAYCACNAEQSSGHATSNLIAHGVKNVFALKGGWLEWKASGLPIAVGPK